MTAVLNTTRIYVDADACPVKDEIYRVAIRHGLPVSVVAGQFIRVPQDPLIERVAGKSVEEQLAQLFRETSARLRLPAGIAVASGIVAAIAAMGSAAVADVTGVLAASAAAAGTLVAIMQRRKILRAYAEEMESKRSELVKTIELQLGQAIELFYTEVAAAFQPLAAFCLTQRRIYEPLLQRAEELQGIFAGLKSRLA